MRKIIKFSILPAIMVLITGCNMNQAYEWFYYDRAKYIIALESDNTEVTYLCVKESTEEKTEKKVNKANSHFLLSMTRL